MELFYSRFVPWFWFGSGERAFSFYSDSDQGWLLDKHGNVMTLERDAQMQVTWRVKLANHPVTVQGQRQIAFNLLTHPAKPKPVNIRTVNWHYRGDTWADGYQIEPIELDEAYLKQRWHTAAQAPKDLPYEQAASFRKDDPPPYRYGRWRNVGVTKEMDQEWEEKGIYYLERQVRVGRRTGWWWDEYWPVGFGRSDNLAMGNAYLRDPATVEGDELPWQSQFLTTTMRGIFKRLARVQATNNVPLRSHTWSNNASLMIESFIWNSLLVEECGAQHRSLEVDMVTQFPSSLYRYICHGYTGLAVHSLPDSIPVRAGDNKMYERQYLGRALLHDIGVSSDGPHGRIHHREQVLRLLQDLTDFGYFEDGEVEFLPYWRNQSIVQTGATKPAPDVHTSIYRRALPNGQGYQVLMVVMNESLKDVEVPLRLLQPEALFGKGGKNTQTGAALPVPVTLPPELADWWAREGANTKAGELVLLDLEQGTAVQRQPGAAESYGPLFVPTHDYRLLYAKFEKGE
jgi:hypothetical protein